MRGNAHLNTPVCSCRVQLRSSIFKRTSHHARATVEARAWCTRARELCNVGKRRNVRLNYATPERRSSSIQPMPAQRPTKRLMAHAHYWSLN
eukprot:2500439-Lingulodinium_polyedra.AAC.1